MRGVFAGAAEGSSMPHLTPSLGEEVAWFMLVQMTAQQVDAAIGVATQPNTSIVYILLSRMARPPYAQFNWCYWHCLHTGQEGKEQADLTVLGAVGSLAQQRPPWPQRLISSVSSPGCHWQTGWPPGPGSASSSGAKLLPKALHSGTLQQVPGVKRPQAT